MSEMNRNESLERWVEGMKIAADRCRELGKRVKNPMWTGIAASLDQLRFKGESIVARNELNKTEILKSVDAFQGARAAAYESEEQKKFDALMTHHSQVGHG